MFETNQRVRAGAVPSANSNTYAEHCGRTGTQTNQSCCAFAASERVSGRRGVRSAHPTRTFDGVLWFDCFSVAQGGFLLPRRGRCDGGQFGQIHYVTVPVEKHRGFVQLVREADADQAMRTGVPCGREIDLAELGEVHCRSSGPGRRAPSCRCRPAAARPCALPVVVPQQQPHQPQDQPATAATNNNVNLTPAMLGGMTQEQVIMLRQ
ncbi:hypothetical protein B0H16DRAFT_170451 [Mycena metata]|uniref:Uncharacterized protein n=1 Tax=Mycena metata TaxID=1033252 RepID=A0AAD7JVA5_9AGAR|nr:hypothetical protein B0H16DRAFT_170451 [Mycena metata]